MKESNMAKADFLMSVLLIVFGITILVTSINMPRYEKMDVNPYSVPGVVPGFLGAVISFMGLTLLIRSLLRKGYKLGLNGQTLKIWAKEDSTRRLMLTLGLSILYAIVFIGLLPYSIGTVLFIFAFIVTFEYKKGITLKEQKRMVWKALITAVISGLSIWGVFRYLFLVSLP